MQYLDLQLIKAHLNLPQDYLADDDYLTLLGSAVEEVVARHTDESMEALAYDNGGTLPAALKVACLMLVGYYYSNREAVAFTSATELPKSYAYILDLFRNYAGDTMQIISDLQARVAELEAYKDFDSQRQTISPDESVNVTTSQSGQTTSLEVADIDEGWY